MYIYLIYIYYIKHKSQINIKYRTHLLIVATKIVNNDYHRILEIFILHNNKLMTVCNGFFCVFRKENQHVFYAAKRVHLPIL